MCKDYMFCKSMGSILIYLKKGDDLSSPGTFFIKWKSHQANCASSCFLICVLGTAPII